MPDWWNHGLSGEDRDEWCTALDSGKISEDLLITMTENQHQWLQETSDGPTMGPDLQAFVAEECSKRLR